MRLISKIAAISGRSLFRFGENARGVPSRRAASDFSAWTMLGKSAGFSATKIRIFWRKSIRCLSPWSLLGAAGSLPAAKFSTPFLCSRDTTAQPRLHTRVNEEGNDANGTGNAIGSFAVGGPDRDPDRPGNRHHGRRDARR